jgi:hypothetical protein
MRTKYGTTRVDLAAIGPPARPENASVCRTESVTEDTDQTARVRCCPPLRAAIQSPVHLSIDERTSPPLDPGAGAGDTEPELVVEPARSASTRLLLASRTVL